MFIVMIGICIKSLTELYVFFVFFQQQNKYSRKTHIQKQKTTQLLLQQQQQGWRGNMIPERAESEVSYTTSFLTNGHRFPYPLPEDGVSVVSRRSYFSNANWGTLPFGEED